MRSQHHGTAVSSQKHTAAGTLLSEPRLAVHTEEVLGLLIQQAQLNMYTATSILAACTKSLLGIAVQPGSMCILKIRDRAH